MKTRKMSMLLSVLLLIALLFTTACSPNGNDGDEVPVINDIAEEPSNDNALDGHYVGYSWRGEADGETFDEADQYIKTILQLDDDGTILDARMLFFTQIDGYWTTRQSGNACVEVDFDVNPTPAVPGDDYEAGDSMFSVCTADMMGFYAVAVSEENATAVALVDWSIDRYAGAVNEDNVFGVDVESGATRTVQDSIDGISGATVRMSREATSYQRALVDASILSEEDVVIGRF